MEKFKSYFKYVNQWSLLFWAFIVLQIVLFVTRDLELWETVWGCLMVWGFFMLGYNSLDRELEIRLDRAKESIRTQKEK